jgi:hypothetical protein
MRQVGRLQRGAGIQITRRQIEAKLGYPLIEAGLDDLRGVIAALEAVYEAATQVDEFASVAASKTVRRPIPRGED